MAKQSIDEGKPSQEYRFFCINAPVNDYKMCWLINDVLGLQLKRVEDIALEENSLQKYSCFRENSEPSISHFLISLKNEKGSITKDLQQFDYVFGIQGNLDKMSDENYINLIADISNVVYVSKMQNGTKQFELLRYIMELQ